MHGGSGSGGNAAILSSSISTPLFNVESPNGSDLEGLSVSSLAVGPATPTFLILRLGTTSFASKLPIFCSVYFYHAAGADPRTDPIYPLTSTTIQYQYSLSFPINASAFGVAKYNDTGSNGTALFIGPLVNTTYQLIADDIKAAYTNNVSSGYVDLYYF